MDTIKWNTNDPKWKGRLPSYFESKNVSVEDGLLKLKSRKVKVLILNTTDTFKNKNKVKYGLFLG